MIAAAWRWDILVVVQVYDPASEGAQPVFDPCAVQIVGGTHHREKHVVYFGSSIHLRATGGQSGLEETELKGAPPKIHEHL